MKGLTQFQRDWVLESEVGDFAMVLGYTPPPNADGFWSTQQNGPVHECDLRATLLGDIALLVANASKQPHIIRTDDMGDC